MMTDLLSICIIGKDTKHLHECINYASKVSSKIIYVDLDADKQNEEKASDLGARIVNKDSLSCALQTQWVVFLKPNEKLVLESKKALESIVKDSSHSGGCLVYTKSDGVKDLIDNYQLVKNLQQYKDIDDLIHVTILEPRLARKSFADFCLKCLMTDSTVTESDINWQTANGLSIDLISNELSKGMENSRCTEGTNEHDKSCLKGEISYGITREENIYELSSHYMGFRVLHERYLNGFLESASRGFGIDNMYLSMLEYLNKNGYFEESKNLFESWINNRDGDEPAIYVIGGIIYGHLFLLDEAITNLKKAAEIHADPSVYAEIGKLYLIKGERENAVTFLEKSIKMKPAPFCEHILSIIKTEHWQPLALSLCMIARDEEHTIGKAIESVKNIVDEIIVVDTGSKDKTKEIAKNLGASVIESKWNDDFSAVRNIALKKAHGDYVFILDSDEFIDVMDQLAFALFKKLLPSSMDVAFNVKIEHDKSSLGLADSLLNKLMKQEPVDYQVRLFPRKDDIFFANTAFESVEQSLLQADVKTGGTPLVKITHRKDSETLRDERKLAAVKKSFSSLDDSQMALKGGLLFLKKGDLEQAYQWFKSVKKEDPVLLSRIAAFYTSQNLHDQAEEIINRALTYHQDFSDLHLALAKIYFKKERYIEVCDVLGKLINSGVEGMEPELVNDASFYYGIALLETGQIAGGIDFVARMLEKDPLNMMYQIGGLYALAKSDQWDEFLDVSGGIIQEEKIKIDFEIRDFSDIGHLILELFHHYIDAGKQDEAMMCQKILTHLIYTKIENRGEIDNIMAQIEKTAQTI